ncbi:MAG: RluA family pseudouridine synthase [Deltaproteobacteria bacterium]|nr:RluA family pseudouridine synthase [Deltaproteobacteria bacterium]
MRDDVVREVVAEAPAGRIDRYLAGLPLSLSRAQVQRLLADGRVRVDGKPVRASHRLKGGEAIRLEIPPPRPAHAEAEDLPVELLYEDPWLAVVSKPRGLVVHPAPGHPSGTLVNALLHRCRDLSGVGGVLRPGIVHRLDKDTSGLLVVAKDDQTHRDLQGQFQGRSVTKVYLAVVVGRLSGEGLIDRPVGRHPTHRKKMAVDVPRGRPAVTRWRVLQPLTGATLVEVRIETGRTHQIRVHLAAAGHAVAGDPLYGGVSSSRGISDPLARRRLSAERVQVLHAWRLGFRHPRTGEALAFEAPVPEEMARLIEDLGGMVPRP